jgi:hypothetical protein
MTRLPLPHVSDHATSHAPVGAVSVLVVVANPVLRAQVVGACRTAGVPVVGASCVAEVERWPNGQIVITDPVYLMPFWRIVGATQVLVVAETADDARTCARRGATGLLSVPPTPTAIAALVARTNLHASLPGPQGAASPPRDVGHA